MATTNALVIQTSVRHVPTDITNRSRKVIDQTNDGLASGIVVAGTGVDGVAFDLSNVTAPGSSYFKNLDSGSDTVIIGVWVTDSVGTAQQFIPFAELSPGVGQHIELSSALLSTHPLRFRCDSGAVKLFYSIQDQ